MAGLTGDRPELDVRICSHKKENDGGFTSVPEGDHFSFPACGRDHEATQEKYSIDPEWVQDQEETKKALRLAAMGQAALAAKVADEPA